VDFREFYSDSYPRIYSAAYAISSQRDVALDATQGAFERAFSRWRRIGREPWVEGWVMTTAINLCKRQFRDSLRERRFFQRPAVEEIAPPNSVRLDLVRGLQTLPFRQRQAVVLFYLGDLPIRAVAELMHISEGAVKAHLAHGRDALRKSLEVANV
jgi:RNA polymerase sigma-70 factor, ECF subfamily